MIPHVTLRAFTCGWVEIRKSVAIAGAKGVLKVPVPVFLIEHPTEGLVLFDSGLHKSCQTDPNTRLGWLMKFHEIFFGPGEDIVARLDAIGIAPADIRYLVNSHLHFDHAGGNEFFPTRPTSYSAANGT